MNTTTPFWEPDWKRIQAPLLALRRQLASFPSPPLRIMKVSQLDAELLDDELFETMKEQLWSAFSLFKVLSLRYSVQRERSAPQIAHI
jgi:peroxin-2